MPPLTASFTGREHELEALGLADRAVIAQAITGMGGVGKTQVAARYVNTHGGEYDLVAWIRAEDGGVADLAQLAVKLGEAVDGLSPTERRDLALEHLSRGEERWLLALDNVESPAGLQDCLPPAGNGRVLVTSRNREVRQFAPLLSLDVFDEQTAIEYLAERPRHQVDHPRRGVSQPTLRSERVFACVRYRPYDGPAGVPFRTRRRDHRRLGPSHELPATAHAAARARAARPRLRQRAPRPMPDGVPDLRTRLSDSAGPPDRSRERQRRAPRRSRPVVSAPPEPRATRHTAPNPTASASRANAVTSSRVGLVTLSWLSGPAPARRTTLGVVALHVGVVGLDALAVGIGHVDLPARGLRRLIWVRQTAEPPALRVAAGRAIVLIGLVAGALSIEIGLQPLGRQHQPLRARARNRIGLLPAALLELAFGVAQPPFATLDAGDDPLRIELKLAVRCRPRLGLGLQRLGVRLWASAYIENANRCSNRYSVTPNTTVGISASTCLLAITSVRTAVRLRR